MSTSESRVALVTGGSRGIGAAIAITLASAGFDIAIVSNERESEAAEVVRVRERGRNVLYCEQDIAQIESHQPLVERICNDLGPIDCLVNNAGVTSVRRGDILDLLPDSFDRTHSVNLRGTFFLTQVVARKMIERTPPQEESRYRSIINITSANAEIVGLNRADYCVTKAGLSMMSRLYAARLASSRIHVFEVRPGIIRTDMTRSAAGKYDEFIAQDGVPLGRWGTPEDVGVAVATIAQGHLPFATGEIVNIGGGLHLHRV